MNKDTNIIPSLDLSQNADFLELLLNTIPNPVFYKNIDGVYNHCNVAFCELILGIPKEIIIGKSLFDIPEYIPYKLAKIYKEKDDYLFENPGSQVYESDVKCSDGEIRRFKFHKATLSDANDKVIGIVGVMLDVTEIYKKQIELNKKNTLLKEMSYKDALTSIYNRRMFNEVFLNKMDISRQNKNIFNFLMLDVDDFKLYNDNYGHLNGDNVLKKIALVLQRHTQKEEDYCFRIGGEEFAVLFVCDDIESSKIVAENICRDIEKLDIKHTTKYGKITASIGLISIKENYISNEDYFYTEVDKLLYKAKGNGKNHVEPLTL